MFDSLVKELDTLDAKEQKSACLQALEVCALHIEKLSYLLEQERGQFIKRLFDNRKILDDMLLKNTSNDRSLRRCLEQFEKSENVDMLVQCLCGHPGKRGIHTNLDARHIKELCEAYKDTVIPILRKQQALVELVNRLVFRLYGINPIEAEQIQAELRDWHT